MNTKLIAARKASGKTQAQVAKESNVSERSYIYYENEVKEPRVQTAIRIARVLDTTVEEIFGEGG
nr:MAG TPA: putative transcriptional regulator [Caudoviricetes sp.]